MSETHTGSAATRREFLKTAGGFTAVSVLAGVTLPHVHAAGTDLIQLALVGCGGRGTGAAANALAVKGGRTRLVAMADVFGDRLRDSLEALKSASSRTGGGVESRVEGYDASQVEVPPDRQFLGFDAYRRAMDILKPGDVVILTTPVAFRWVHFAYAIERGLHVFMEKPISVDGPTTRRMLALAAESDKKSLKVGVGLMCRHCAARRELYARIRGGEIGEITALRTYRQVGPAGFVGPRSAGQRSELLYQIRHYLGFFWASGGVFHDYIAHNVDECCWMKDAWPVRAQGQGGRLYRGEAVDQNFDNYSVEYSFADGTRLFVQSRYMGGCREEFASYAHGTKGSAVISTAVHTPARCRTYRAHEQTRSNLLWAFPQPEPNPYVLEWEHLLDAIRRDEPYNEVERGARASLTVAMGRKAVHTGQIITFDEMLAGDEEFAPGVGALTSDSPAPLQADAAGRYPVPQPGIQSTREY